jgi:hypothetical protein
MRVVVAWLEVATSLTARGHTRPVTADKLEKFRAAAIATHFYFHAMNFSLVSKVHAVGAYFAGRVARRPVRHAWSRLGDLRR